MGVIRKVITVTPVLANAGAYAANDQVGAVNTLTNAARDTGGTVEIEGITLIDKAKQSLALDIYFFDVLPVLDNADNAAFSMTDARMAAGYKGHVSFVAGDYAAAALNSTANKRDLALFVRALDASKDLYCVVVTRGNPTYADGDLVFNVGLISGRS